MNKTFFSLIMLVYNTKEEYLRYALSSLLNQTYSNYEIVIVDDGSNKQTKEILNEYEDKCHIIHQKNMGMPASRIEGLKVAKGNYVMFVDSDDYIVPETLELFNSYIDKYNVDIVMQDFTKFSGSIDNILHKNSFFKDGLVDKNEVIRQLCLLHTNGTCGRAVKKELFGGMENSIDKSIATGEDVQQSAYVLSRGNSFYYTSKNIYYYRIVEEHRDYYGIKQVNDCDFLTPVYQTLFVKNDTFDSLLPTFKSSAINSVIYNGFRICLIAKNNKDRNELLNELNKLKINSIINSINSNISFPYNVLYWALNKKHYSLLAVFAKAYDLVGNVHKF